MSEPYLVRLAARTAATRSVLCLGIDPDPVTFPPGFSTDAAGAESFAQLLLNHAGPIASAVKFNLAFFEAFGSSGIAALERVRAAVPPELPVILDAKRADVASTSARHAVALFDALGADAVTASPYLGSDALEPLLGRADRYVYVLCRTSNPGAGELQDLEVVAPGGAAAEPLFLHVARRAASWGGGAARVGLVVGATAPAELERVREVVPELAFLVPGVGEQGGEADAVLRAGGAREGDAAQRPGAGLLVNVTRGIARAASATGDPATNVRQAAARWARRLEC